MEKKIPRKKKEAVKLLRLCSSTAEGVGLKIKILHALWLRQKKKKTERKNMKSRTKDGKEEERNERKRTRN